MVALHVVDASQTNKRVGFITFYAQIDCTIHLSGTPDLALIFNNPRLLDDVGLHPCVRYFRWDRQRVLSFIPPDGKFRLFTYFIPNLR